MTQEELLAGVVIPIDKPRQWTSFQAVNKIKTVIRNTYGLKKFKIGHAGTLDPLATGLLLICVGKATKRIDQLQSGEKTYSGTFVLGATTPCYDLERAIDHYYPYQHITLDLIERTLPQFLGTIQQVPPIFSAVKINGYRAYQYAREATPGTPTPAPTPKAVHIAEFQITDFRPGKPQNETIPQPNTICPTPADPTAHHLYDHPQGTVPEHLPQLDFRIRCGKGTYIRSIARDFGLALDSGAFLSALRREAIGSYTLADAVSFDDLPAYFAS
ncbi:MAG: tRNA pseudouridine(55) synthase TruB [Bacteroidales bacterium]|nr:tRNA pseudouridine(55) synthase TruB [Bacteroidales bacterium]